MLQEESPLLSISLPQKLVKVDIYAIKSAQTRRRKNMKKHGSNI